MATNVVPLPGVSKELHCCVLSMKSPEKASHTGYPQCACAWSQFPEKLCLVPQPHSFYKVCLRWQFVLWGLSPGLSVSGPTQRSRWSCEYSPGTVAFTFPEVQ